MYRHSDMSAQPCLGEDDVAAAGTPNFKSKFLQRLDDRFSGNSRIVSYGPADQERFSAASTERNWAVVNGRGRPSSAMVST